MPNSQYSWPLPNDNIVFRGVFLTETPVLLVGHLYGAVIVIICGILWEGSCP